MGQRKKCDFMTGIEPLSPGSTDKDWKPVPEILNPRRVLDFYLQPTYLSATSFHLRRSMILVVERTILYMTDLAECPVA